MSSLIRQSYTISGQVQGVGFRPFVYRLAERLGLTGFVRNTTEGVNLEVQGEPAALVSFVMALRSELPPLARISDMRVADIPTLPAEREFIIAHSQNAAAHGVLVSPDVAMCADCAKDIANSGERRYNYPFTNCTNCGPRYTITRKLPYDRPNTSLAGFPLCPACLKEYENPEDRRFHAQPTACPVCGPQVSFHDADGTLLSEAEAAVKEAGVALARGKIVAVKGLGGFHLACDAGNSEAVLRLRERKQRPHKPLALMVPDLSTARAIAQVSDVEAELMAGAEAPVVLCVKRSRFILNSYLAPDCPELGIMLPYTPLHQLLINAFREIIPSPSVLVMTSGNPSGEPICLDNKEALAKLAGYADFFLLHNRDILARVDDSVLRVVPGSGADALPGQVQFLRRARGFVPRPIRLNGSPGQGAPLLAVGAELKNTFCLCRGDEAFVSQHVGDLNCLENQVFFEEAKEHLCRLLDMQPEAVIHDLHPDYLSTRLALDSGLPHYSVQHHAAHIFGVAAEHGIAGRILGPALGGAGLGDDSTIWGGELLLIDNRPAASLADCPNAGGNNYCRLGHLALMPLPGGDAAARTPWRMAQGLLSQVGVDEPLPEYCHWIKDEAGRTDANLLCQMLRQDVNVGRTSSCGRLFDAVAGLLGFPATMSFEGQAAAWLEQLQTLEEQGRYACPTQVEGERRLLNIHELFAQVWEDVRCGIPAGIIARRFHLGLIQGLADMTAQAAQEWGINAVALSGGVLQNRTVALVLPELLRERGLTPLLHKEVPCNDGGISLGQAAWARAKGL